LQDSDSPFRRSVDKEAVYLLTRSGKLRLPTPPTMHNRRYYIASLCEIVRWLGAKAEALGVTVFTGFPAAQLLVRGQAVAGVRTAAAGLDRDGKPTPGASAPNDLTAKVTALAGGTRGLLAQAWCERRAKAEALGVTVSTGFPAAQLLARGQAVAGVRTAAAGRDRAASPAPGAATSFGAEAKVTALAGGTRGLLAQAWCERQHVPS